MTLPSITSLALDTKGDLFTTSGGSGRTIVISRNHEVVSNLVKARVRSEIDWELLSDDSISPLIIRQKIRTVISHTDGVNSLDLSGFLYTKKNRNVDLGNICFTIDCINRIEDSEL